MAVVVPILSTFNAAGINAATGALGALGNSLKRIGLQAAAAAIGVKAMGAAVDFVSESVTAARDLERNLFALNTVFGKLAPQMTQFTKDAANMGISQVDAARTATYLGSVLKQAGFSMSDTASETVKLTTLAQDLATTYGYDVSEALTAMTALFRGEYDPIEKFGVALKQNEINTLLAAKGMGNLTGQALLNAQQQIRLEQLYKRTADAQGAFAAQSYTLYGSQGRLNATFENMKTALGDSLLPVINRFTRSLIPLVNTNAPKLQSAFDGLGKTIDAIAPLVDPVIRIIGDLIGALGNLMSALAPVIEMLSNVLAGALDFVAAKLESLARGIDELVGPLSDFIGTLNTNMGSSLTQFLTDVFDRISSGNIILRQFYDLWVAITGKFAPKLSDETDRLLRQRLDRLGANSATPNPNANSNANSKQQAKNYVQDFYAGIKEETAKQTASLKLKKLGASDALAESIIGSGDGWKKIYQNIISGGVFSVATVQNLFNKTKAGIAEITKAAEESAAAAKKLRDDAIAAYKDEKDAFDARIAAINEFKDAIAGITATLKPLAFTEREIGRFESAVVSSFDNIKQTLKDGLADGKLTTASAKTLQEYADKEFAVLSQLARQRDELKAKYDLASALISETRSAVVAYANITSMLNQQTTMVTETIQTMVDGVRLTRTSTREQITQGNNLVDSFKAILEKTVAFGKNLKQLRALGLDKNLYKQIVDAGLEAGGATAAAIIEGGAGTVSELNNLFSQLDAVGADIAETSATVMFNNGVDIVGGLLEGLRSQDAALVSNAEAMASAFATAFNAMLQNAIKFPTMPGVGSSVAGVAVGKPDMTQAQYVASQNEYLANYLATGATVDYGAASGGSYGRQTSVSTTTNNVYVTAGAITDQASLPQVIVDALGTYTKQSGAGGLTRILGL